MPRAGPAPRTRRTASSCGDSVDLERALHHLLQPRQIELALPAADDQRRHAVADQIGQRAAFARESNTSTGAARPWALEAQQPQSGGQLNRSEEHTSEL